jgi:hypothetical protein
VNRIRAIMSALRDRVRPKPRVNERGAAQKVDMSESPIQLKYRGHVVQGAPSRDGWTITDPTSARPGHIDWRVLLVAPGLAALPVVLTGLEDLRSLAEQFDRHVKVPDDLRRALEEALESPKSSGGGAGKDLVSAHKQLRKEYQKLGERKGLDPNSDELFLEAVKCGLLHSLTLCDEVHDGKDPVPVGFDGAPDFIPDLLHVTGDPEWVASACIWDGRSSLYEKSNPRSNPGRSLELYGDGYRTDLRNLKSKQLKQPPGPPDPTPPKFVVRAAETTS